MPVQVVFQGLLPYVVECKADGYNSDKKQINVSADGQVINLTFQLTPAE